MRQVRSLDRWAVCDILLLRRVVGLPHTVPRPTVGQAVSPWAGALSSRLFGTRRGVWADQHSARASRSRSPQAVYD